MSNQIGNLRNQMETTQAKKTTTQADLNATQTQKREMELRLQQFRSQYETEVRSVKELEAQLAASRDGTKKLGQELAMLEGTHQDLQTQHGQVSQHLQADLQENAALKQRIGQLNAQVTQLRPQIEKMRLNARQQKGLVSINRKQLATNEGERERLQGEKATLDREAAEREEVAKREAAEQEEAAKREAAEREETAKREAAERDQAAQNAPQQQSHSGRDTAIEVAEYGAAGAAGAGAAGVAGFGAPIVAGFGAAGAAAFGAYEAVMGRHPSGDEAKSPPPAAGTLSPTNPFFRKTSGEGAAERATSPPPASSGGATPSAFDALFGPSAAFSPGGQAASRSGTPPPTSFTGRNVSQQPSASVDGPAPANMTGSVQSISSAGEPTPSVTPPLSDQAKESPVAPPSADQIPPPPPENRQFTPSQLPMGPLTDRSREDPEVSSTVVRPPVSRAGGVETPRERAVEGDAFSPPSALTEPVDDLPGAFPSGPDEVGQAAMEGPAPAQAARGNDDFDSAFSGFGGGEKSSSAAGNTNSEFDSVFAGFGDGEKTREAPSEADDPFAPSSSQQRSGPHSSEFPPIQSLEPESEEESSDEDEDHAASGQPRSFDSVGPASPPPPGHGAAEPTSPAVLSAAKHALPEANIAGARPTVQSVESSASTVPSLNAQQSPPTYEQSNEPSHGGSGARSGSNQFPPEFGGLLPSREDPTSPPPPTSSPPVESAVEEEKENYRPAAYSPPNRSGTGSSSLYPTTVPQTPSTGDFFHDASSRPISSVTDTYATPPSNSQHASQQAPKGDFDDFDDFNGLSEAKEADKAGPSDFDFGFGGGRQSADEFHPGFDSPAGASTSNTMASAQQTPVPSARQLDGFSTFGSAGHIPTIGSSPFDHTAPETSSIQHTPQGVQHDWDAIFSGLDSNKNVDTSFAGSDDLWGSPPAAASSSAGPVTNGAPTTSAADRTPTTGVSKAAQAAAQMGRAITPGTEHDDPILKRLTGMGYARNDALKALEMYDYDINMAVDHLTGK
ncbi:hypothetical protein LTR53_007821 [Teratosphaeriaceae sp. CCFEE 6253]|nr:hypothetical protein LTR53_007821 [Teratosphaeriaceae sp. CCFEE 6253]